MKAATIIAFATCAGIAHAQQVAGGQSCHRVYDGAKPEHHNHHSDRTPAIWPGRRLRDAASIPEQSSTGRRSHR
jgi:hypothetical protein